VSRCGYTDDSEDALEFGRWRAQVMSAIRGKRGQKFLADLVAALDALPEPRLVANELEDSEGVCALGALGRARGVALVDLDTEDYEQLGTTFNIAHQLAQETMFINDERARRATPEERWRIVRWWALKQLRAPEVKP